MCLPARSPRRRFTLRADDGFLAAWYGLAGPAVTVVPDFHDAVLFVDFHTAALRGHLMTELGWPNLRVVEVALD